MLIKFYNLGCIKETELDLRPLTVIIGPNNSNKTYIAYSVYALWEEMIKHKFMRISYFFRKSIIQQDKNKWTVRINDGFISLLQQEYTKKNFTLNLREFFQDYSGKLFQNTKFDFIPSFEEYKGIIK